MARRGEGINIPDVVGFLAPVGLGTIRVPAVRVVVDQLGPPRLEWTAGQETESPPLRTCLTEFVRLATGDSVRIGRFASRWGPLGLCRHGKPFGCHPDCTPLGKSERSWESPQEQTLWAGWHGETARKGDDGRTGLRPFDKYRRALVPHREWAPRHWEPIAPWPFYAQRLHAIMRLARDLETGSMGQRSDWWMVFADMHAAASDDLLDPSASELPTDDHGLMAEVNKLDDRARRLTFARRLTELVREARIAPSVTWDGLTPRREVALGKWRHPEWWESRSERRFDDMLRAVEEELGPTLYGVLVVQAVAALSVTDKPALCQECGARLPERKAPGKQRYCADCREVKRRETKRRSWQAHAEWASRTPNRGRVVP